MEGFSSILEIRKSLLGQKKIIFRYTFIFITIPTLIISITPLLLIFLLGDFPLNMFLIMIFLTVIICVGLGCYLFYYFLKTGIRCFDENISYMQTILDNYTIEIIDALLRFSAFIILFKFKRKNGDFFFIYETRVGMPSLSIGIPTKEIIKISKKRRKIYISNQSYPIPERFLKWFSQSEIFFKGEKDWKKQWTNWKIVEKKVEILITTKSHLFFQHWYDLGGFGKYPYPSVDNLISLILFLASILGKNIRLSNDPPSTNSTAISE